MQLLQEMLTESLNNQMAADAVYTGSKSLNQAMKQSIGLLDDAIEWNDPGQALPAIAPVTKWMNDNYQSSRRGPGGYGMHTALTKMSHLKQFRGLTDSALDIVKDNAFKDKKASKTKQAISLAAALSKIVKKIGQTGYGDDGDLAHYNRTSQELAEIASQFERKFKQLKSIKMKDRGVDPRDARRGQAKKAKMDGNAPPDVRGQQAQQAEQIINQVLRDLPKDVASDIRSIVMRSDNKLQALQQEMKVRGL